uniref:Uncharacterized protein n=1 Tax=Timema poppense TaxID=170557 RepID=A0A7R9DIA3_TIMPO|nr:unnamed protein product [Timema poppensis]
MVQTQSSSTGMDASRNTVPFNWYGCESKHSPLQLARMQSDLVSDLLAVFIRYQLLRKAGVGVTHTKTYQETKEGEGVIIDGKHLTSRPWKDPEQSSGFGNILAPEHRTCVTSRPWKDPEQSSGLGNILAPEHRTCDHAVLMSLLASRCQS